MATAKRRRFSASEKRQILGEADACKKPGELGALLRRKRHFRRLPPAWSALFASGLLPPLAAYGLIEGCAVAQTLLSFLMRK